MALNLFSCKPTQKEEPIKLDWEPGINAPKHYPIRTIFGWFSNGENSCGITRGGVEMADGAWEVWKCHRAILYPIS